MKLCTASAPTPLCAVIVIGKVPPTVGVPLNTPVPTLNITPAGNVPASLNVGAGEPVAVTVNDHAVPTVNVALLVLVIAGATRLDTVSVKLCVGSTTALLNATIPAAHDPGLIVNPAATAPLPVLI